MDLVVAGLMWKQSNFGGLEMPSKVVGAAMIGVTARYVRSPLIL